VKFFAPFWVRTTAKRPSEIKLSDCSNKKSESFITAIPIFLPVVVRVRVDILPCVSISFKI